MQELGPGTPALTPEQILAQYSQAIDQMLAAIKEPSHEFERLVQIRKARYNWRMVKGDQFIAPGFTADWAGSEIVDYVTVDSFPSDDETGDQVAFAYPVNVLGGDLWKFVAVMGQSAPRVKAVADDPEDPEALDKSKNADAVLRDAREKQNWDALTRVLAFHQYVTGPLYGYTPWVTDRLKYGQSTEPQVDTQDQVQEDGSTIPVPMSAPPKTYANGDVELHLESVLSVAHAFAAKNLGECGWFDYQKTYSKWMLIATYPELAQFRDSDPPDDDFDSGSISAVEAQDSVSNPSGQGRSKKQNEWRRRMTWFQPMYFEAIQDEGARKVFQQQFPDGVRIVRVGSFNVASGLKPEKLTDVMAVCKTGRGEKILEDPICQDAVPIQRCLNDLINLAIETVLRSIAQTIVDQMLLDRNAMSHKEALPAEIIFTTMPMGTDITKMIAQIPPAQVSAQLVPLFQMLRTLQQDITGIRPELSGGGEPTQTFREAKQRKDQALLQLSPQAAEIVSFWEQVGTNDVKQRARYGSGTIKVPKKSAFESSADVVDLANLAEDGWHCEGDDGIPMSFTDIADRFFSLLKDYPPEVQAQLQLLDPINLDQNLELLELPEHTSPYENQKKKTVSDIQQLLQAQPITGPDGSPQPSLPVDPYDDHQFVALFLSRWLVSPAGQDAAKTNQAGFSNVVAFWTAQNDAANPPQQPPPPVRASFNVSAKAEDFPPEFLSEIMAGAAIQQQPAPPGPTSAPGGSPAGPPPGPNGQPDTPQSPLPPMPPGNPGQDVGAPQ